MPAIGDAPRREAQGAACAKPISGNQEIGMSVKPPIGASAEVLLTLAAENAELRLQLAEAQEQCIEMAVDAGELQAEIDALRA